MAPLIIPVMASSLSIVLVIFLFGGALTPSKIQVSAGEGQLRVRIHGKDAIFAVSRGMSVPLRLVQTVSVVPRDSVPREGLRLPGTGIPGLLRAGSYGTGASRDFWLVRRAPSVLVVELRPGAAYRRLVLQVPEPHATRDALTPELVAGESTSQ